jgi:uncharacterized protein YndB with AHSA1/START domain
MPMLKIAALVVVVAIAAVLILAAMKPDVFRLERSTTIKAPPEKIYALIEDFHRWGLWSPYEKLDPNMSRTHSGAERGLGAAYAWSGSGKAGAGRMEITDTAAPTRIVIALDFTKPMEAKNIVEFSLVPRGEVTEVTWAMHGPTPFFGKIFHVFVNMDRMVGGDFEAGLAALKAEAEK